MLLPALIGGFTLSLMVGLALLIGSGGMRPEARTGLLIGYGVYLIALVGGIGALLALSAERFQVLSAWLTRRLSGRWAWIAALILIEIPLIVVPILTGVAPILAPLAWLLIGWVILALIFMAAANSAALSRIVIQGRTLWIGVGVALSALVLIGILATVTSVILTGSGVVDRLRGGADFRDLVFYGGEVNPARSRAYWVELGGLRAQWLSYTYSRMSAHEGEFINIDRRGLRRTDNPSPDPTLPEIFLFGGSTLWGEGSRDGYTIPSQLAAQLYEYGSPAVVTNFGQIAYVSTQDAILFQRQLALGDVPDVAIFYGGFNDIAAVTISDGAAGLPHNEVNRLRDLIAGNVLRSGRPVLREPSAALGDADFSLVALPNATPEQIAALYLANARLIRASAEAFGVRVIFVWQPALIFKQSLSTQEQLFADQNRQALPGFDDLYRATDAALRAQIAAEGLTDVVILSDLFADETGYIFYDRVHVIEDANTRIAAAVMAAMVAFLE